MNVLYNTGIALYGLGTRIASLWDDKARRLVRGRSEAKGYLKENTDRSGRYVWIHASSAGEFEQGLPIMEMIKREFPGKKILLTFYSPSGYELYRGHPLADAVCYLPLDLPGRVREFIEGVHLEMALFVKYEFWGNCLEQLHRRGIPVYLVSALFRKNQPFFKWYGAVFRRMLRCYRHVFVQDDCSRDLLAGIGIRAVTVAGDTRFDRVSRIASTEALIEQAQALASSSEKVLVAGSTWAADEEILIPYFNRRPGMKLIIAPHVVNPSRIAQIESRLQRSHCRLSEATPALAAASDCLIVDCYGKLSAIYRYGKAAYVGGGFGAGVHNVLEAAVYSMPVIIGPRHEKSREALELIKIGGAFGFDDPRGFETVADRLLEDGEYLRLAAFRAGDYICGNLGTTEKIFREIFRRG